MILTVTLIDETMYLRPKQSYSFYTVGGLMYSNNGFY
jgi:hypothetical protein